MQESERTFIKQQIIDRFESFMEMSDRQRYMLSEHLDKASDDQLEYCKKVLDEETIEYKM